MSPFRQHLKDLIRDGVRATIQSTLPCVIEEVREEKWRHAICLELQQAIEELRYNGKPKASRKR